MELLEKLRKLKQNDPYPMHMPGHKRVRLSFPDVYDIDITEVEGYDNLHHPTGIIKDLASEVAELYDADEAYLSVGGSTDMNLVSFFAATKKGDKALIARNCHKSIYHAAILRGSELSYIYPEIGKYGIPGAITPEQVDSALNQEEGIRTCVITSPTYEGVISDVGRIAEICHAHGVSLIVDCAHGAHLGAKGFHENPIDQGADAVVISLHKTLPSLTQTACLLRNTDSMIDARRLKKYFDYFETSSPSYVLMAGIDRCVTFLREKGRNEFAEYYDRLEALRDRIESIDGVELFTSDVYDDSKIVIHISGMSGTELADWLRKYGIEPEMASLQYVICMTSVMDTDEGFDRLYDALEKLSADKQYSEGNSENEAICSLYSEIPDKQDKIDVAEYNDIEYTDARNAVGAECGDIITVYPPGIPLIVPGEIYTGKIIDTLVQARNTGLEVDGTIEGRLPVIRK